MTLFDGQAADSSFSDDALFAEVVAIDADAEKQEEEQPQAETDADGPAGEWTSQEADAEAAELDGQPEEDAPTEEWEQDQQVLGWERQVQEATARMTRACQDAAMLKRQNEQLTQRLNELTQRQAAPNPQANEAFLQAFLENPQAELARLAQAEAGRMAAAQVQQILQPVLGAVEHQSREQAWSAAWQEHAYQWPQLQDRAAQQQLVATMTQISADFGDVDLWQKQPARLLTMAASELFGAPVAIDESAIVAANEAGRKAALAELNAKNGAKAGLAAATGASRNEAGTLTAEEQILKEIEGAFGGRYL